MFGWKKIFSIVRKGVITHGKFYLSFLGKLLDKPCAVPVISPIDAQGVGISDHEVIVWFFKPLTDQYDYQMVYNNPTVMQKAYWTTYGPVWADFIKDLTPSKAYPVKVYFLCYKDKNLKSKKGKSAYPTVLGPCKLQSFLNA